VTVAKRPKYELKFSWGGFQLNIVGRWTILRWAALIGSLIGAANFGSKLFVIF
jgi:hypothetical protein